MAATIGDRVFDNGLTVLDTEATHLYLCSAQPTSYAEATTTYALGNKASISVGAPGDRTGGGRKVTVAAITDGEVTADGLAAWIAVVDGTNSRLLATQALTASQNVYDGNVFTTPAFDVGLPDPSA